jgi:hypothetical protein
MVGLTAGPSFCWLYRSLTLRRFRQQNAIPEFSQPLQRSFDFVLAATLARSPDCLVVGVDPAAEMLNLANRSISAARWLIVTAADFGLSRSYKCLVGCGSVHRNAAVGDTNCKRISCLIAS